MAVVFVQVIFCILAADFFSGFFHWLEDTYGVPDMPFVGSRVVVPTIHHHRAPGAMAKRSAWDINLQSVGLAALVVGALAAAGVFCWQIVLTAGLAGLSNQVHAWSHGHSKGNGVVRFLQEAGLVQTPANHAKHHAPPYDKDYCVLTNWLNPVLSRLRFWRILEAVIGWAGVTVKRGSAARDGF